MIYLQKEDWTHQLLVLFNVLYYISGILYYVSSTINPILYNIMSLKFRQAFKNTIFRPCRRKKKRPKVLAYKFYSRPLNTDSHLTAAGHAAAAAAAAAGGGGGAGAGAGAGGSGAGGSGGSPIGNGHRGKRGPASQSSSMSAGSSARMLADDPFDGMELEHLMVDMKSLSCVDPRTCVLNTNYRPYHSYA